MSQSLSDCHTTDLEDLVLETARTGKPLSHRREKPQVDRHRAGNSTSRRKRWNNNRWSVLVLALLYSLIQHLVDSE